jgi:hypothetical protein
MPRKAVSSARAYPPLLALGPWRNEETFWKALVERKRLPHLGHPFGRSPVRDRLALGPVVFAGAPDAGEDFVAYLAFIEPGFPRWLDHFGMAFAPFPWKTQRF